MLQKGRFLLKVVPTDDNVADLMAKHLAAARVEELLSKLGVRRCARRLAVASLITRVEADHFDARADHLATVCLAHEVMLPVVECVVLVLALVVPVVAGAYCCWRRCSRDTATRECQGLHRSTKASINLCQQCCNERLTVQGQAPFKSWQWKAVAEQNAHRGRLWKMLGK